MAASESVRFDIIGNDRASDAFSRVGRSVGDMGLKMDAATKAADFLDDALKRQRETTKRTADAALSLAKSDAILAEVQHRLADGALEAEFALKKEADALKSVKREADRLDGKKVNVKVRVDRSAFSRLFGVKGGAGQATGLEAILPGATGLLNPYTIGLGVAATPFLGTAIGGSILGALGTGLTGLGIFGALSGGGNATPAQMAAAQLRVTAAQQHLAAVQAQGAKASPGSRASAQAALMSAQAAQKQLQPPNATRAAFTSLFGTAEKDLQNISKVFQGPLQAIAKTFGTVLPYVFRPLGQALKEIAPVLQQIGETLAISFASPRIQASIAAVTKAFTQFLGGFTGQIPGIVNALATGIESIANSFTRHPDMIIGMEKVLAFLLKLPGYVASGLAALTNVTHWLLFGLPHDVSIGLDNTRKFLLNFGKNTEDDFNNVLHAIRVTWNDIYGATIGAAIRIGHDAEAQFNSLRHAIANIFDGVRHDIAHTWDLVIAWLGGLPGRILAAVGKAGSVLSGWGAGVIRGLLAGFGSVWNAVKNFFTSLPSRILGWLGIHSPPQWAIDAGKHIVNGIGIGMDRAHERVKTATQALAAIAGKTVGGIAGVPAQGGPATAQQTAMKMAALVGWTGAEWTALNNVAMRESGWSMTARNPSSGAYGIAQFINGPLEYASYGGNYQTLSGQLIGFFNYIKQRYVDPVNAWEHELNYGWYGNGLDATFSSPTLIGVGERGPERVTVTPTGRGGSGNTYVINVNVAPGGNLAEAGRQTVNAIRAFEQRSGASWRS